MYFDMIKVRTIYNQLSPFVAIESSKFLEI